MHLLVDVRSAYFHLPVNTSVRSVAGGGVLDKLVISAYISSVILKSAAVNESSNWFKFRAPMIGAVTAGLAITQATAKCEKEWVDATLVFFEYFKSNYLFFSTMLASKGAPSFRSKFLEFLIEEFKDEVDKGKNQGLSEDVVVKFAANAFVGVLESWLKDEMPSPPESIAKELGSLLERIV
jgi:hypothetical protein